MLKYGFHTMVKCRPCLNLNLSTVTDAAFVHLRGIQKLDMGNQETIMDAAFVHLRGIQTLMMLGCNQATITDAAFVHLRGIQELDMSFATRRLLLPRPLCYCAGFKVEMHHYLAERSRCAP